MVSIRTMSMPPSSRPFSCRHSHAQLVEGDVARARSLTSGEMEAVLGCGPSARRPRSAACPACCRRHRPRAPVGRIPGSVRRPVPAGRSRPGRWRWRRRCWFDDVGPGLQVLTVDLGDHIRPDQGQQFVVALQILAVAGEALAAEIRLAQLARWIMVPMAPSRIRCAGPAVGVAAAGKGLGRIGQTGIRHEKVLDVWRKGEKRREINL